MELHPDLVLSSNLVGFRGVPGSQQRPLLQRKTVQQTFQLLLTQLDLVLQFALLDDESRLHLHEIAVVVQTLRVQVGLHDACDQPLATVQVLL